MALSLQIDAKLKKYYQLIGAEYDGQFSAFCDENGIEEEDIREDLEGDSDESMLVDFDDDFPFAVQPESDEERMEFVFDILYKCYKKRKLTKSFDIPKFNKGMFSASSSDISMIKERYRSQCPRLYGRIEACVDRGAIWKTLFIQLNLKFDYIWHLSAADDFYKITHPASRSEWSRNYPHFQMLKGLGNGIIDLVLCGLGSLRSARIFPTLTFDPYSKINSSLELTSKYIHAATQLIPFMQKQKKIKYPFQVDLCIAVDIESDHKESIEDIVNIRKELHKEGLAYVFNEYKESEIISGDGSTLLYKSLQQLYGDISGKRVVFFVDRRTLEEKSNGLNDVYTYFPSDYMVIPSNAFPEWYLDATETDSHFDIDYHDKTSKVLTISFHVKQMDEVKAYLFFGGMSRFMPNHMKVVFPWLFNMDENNKKFIGKEKKLNVLLKEMNHVIKDAHLDAFQK